MSVLKTVDAGCLRVAFRDEGSTNGWPVVLAHGFPYDVHAFDESMSRLPRRERG